MRLLKRSDLQYKSEYKWTTFELDNPKITGIPNSTYLNRKEGYEVLAFINRFAQKHSLQKEISGLKIELMIHDHLPLSIYSHVNIEIWIENNWKYY